VDIQADEFYRRLPELSALPTTSQPSAGDFMDCYKAIQEDGAEGIISIHLSSGISGTINSAQLAAQELDIPVEIIDTQSAAACHILATELAAREIAAGGELEDIAAYLRAAMDAERTMLTVDTLEYLYKGGRIGGAAALVGSLLQFKPLLYFADGRIDALERVRTSPRALRRMVEIMAEWMADAGPLRAFVMHAADPDRASALASRAESELDVESVETLVVPPVLGAHCGPGTVGLCCCPLSACGPRQ